MTKCNKYYQDGYGDSYKAFYELIKKLRGHKDIECYTFDGIEYFRRAGTNRVNVCMI